MVEKLGGAGCLLRKVYWPGGVLGEGEGGRSGEKRKRKRKVSETGYLYET
jgi:hypothetical protein